MLLLYHVYRNKGSLIGLWFPPALQAPSEQWSKTRQEHTQLLCASLKHKLGRTQENPAPGHRVPHSPAVPQHRGIKLQ